MVAEDRGPAEGNFGRSRKVSEGFECFAGSLKGAHKGALLPSIQGISEGFRKFRRVPEGFEWFRKVSEGFGRFAGFSKEAHRRAFRSSMSGISEGFGTFRSVSERFPGRLFWGRHFSTEGSLFSVL